MQGSRSSNDCVLNTDAITQGPFNACSRLVQCLTKASNTYCINNAVLVDGQLENNHICIKQN